MGEGMDDLLNMVELVLTRHTYRTRLLLPYERGDLVSHLYESATVNGRENTPEGVLLVVQLPASLYERFKQYQVVE
jgi:GTP-binding protein HflX